MAGFHTLTSSQIILLAVQLATESELRRLQVLAAARKDVLDTRTIYSLLLTFLPVDLDSQSTLATFLQHASQDFTNISELDAEIDIPSNEGVSESDAHRRIKELRFSKFPSAEPYLESDLLSDFIIQWIYRVEAISGLSNAHLHFVDGFVDSQPQLLKWRNAYLAPLCRLQNDLYPGQADSLNLNALEQTYGEAGVKLLVQFAEASSETPHIGRDLREVVVPWVQGSSSSKRRKLQSGITTTGTGWRDVYSWIYNISDSRFDLAAKAIIEWDGPPDAVEEDTVNTPDNEADPHLLYAKAILAVVLSSPTRAALGGHQLEGLLQRATETALGGCPRKDGNSLPNNATKAHLMRNQLLNDDNPLTNPSDETFQFISTCIKSQDILESFSFACTIATIAEVSLFGSEEKQKQELARLLTQIPKLARAEHSWEDFRKQIQALRSAKGAELTNTTPTGFLGRLTREYIESEILAAMLTAGQYSTLSEIYLSASDSTLDRDTVKDAIITAIFSAYDNASNGNRTRGGLKKASDLLKTFQPRFPDEDTFHKIGCLIKATHSLSFYQLTLQHGVPFKPVNVRAHHDPLSLVEKVLEQNSKAYTKLDDLLEIGQNLVKSDLATSVAEDSFATTMEEKSFNASHRITFLAINAALNEHDFDTAYSYITTRLSTDPSQASSNPFTDDTSWRAAYAAGKYRPSVPAKSIHESITSLSKRMDLLSLALILAPTAEPLSEILATWRRSEEEMESLRSQAVTEERSLESASAMPSTLPGGFAPEGRDLDAAETKRINERRANAGFSPTYEEEAPMGLFDVARGAASAFKKSAFPLTRAAPQNGRPGTGGYVLPGQGSPAAITGDEELGTATDAQKTRRKRDVVSGIVTGSLVSGMSWVLGAQPAGNGETGERD